MKQLSAPPYYKLFLLPALTSAEIANVLGISQQNVRVRVFRALRRLRELMTPQASTATPGQ